MNKNRKSDGVFTAGFSQSFIQKVQDSVDFEEVVNRYTSLRRRGSQLLGLCPFHNEKTPSFSVDPDRGLFHCFGCGKGGNIFTFLMEKESISFPEAVTQLAKEAGIPIPQTSVTSERGRFLDTLYEANEFALKIYQDYLKKPVGLNAKEYLLKRGFTEAILRDFLVGYVPPRWDCLYSAVSKTKMNYEPFHKTGLLKRKDAGGYYDYFRGRIIFPILNPGKRVIAFAGREFDNEGKEAKYVNSPESPVYQKNRIVYGIWLTKDHIRREKRVILVEGYTDLLALWQIGIKNVAASCGTAFTEQQASLLKRYANEAIILFDGDEAGLQASLRTIPILLSAGFETRCLSLPPEEDPASFISSKGADTLRELLENSPGWFDLLYDRAIIKNPISYPENKIKVIRQIVENLARINDNLILQVFVHKLSTNLIVPEELIVREIEKIKKRTKGIAQVEDTPKKFDLNQQQKNELELFALLINDNNFIKKLDISKCRDLFVNYPGILLNMSGIFDKKGQIEFSDMSNMLVDSQVRGFITGKLFQYQKMKMEDYFSGLLNKLITSKLKREIDQLTDKLLKAEKNKDTELASQLNKQIMNLQHRRREFLHAD